MPTTNLISTPEVTGNIGSCTSFAQPVLIRSGFFKEEGYTVVTNSCTGEVTNTNYTALADIGVAMIITLGVILIVGVLFCLMTWLSRYY